MTFFGLDPLTVVRATAVGCPNHSNAETSRENSILHWREGNHTPIKKNMVAVLNSISKEQRNCYNIPLPYTMVHHSSALSTCSTSCFVMPAWFLMQHSLPPSIWWYPLHWALNLATCTGTSHLFLYKHIWDLQITYPGKDIVWTGKNR